MVLFLCCAVKYGSLHLELAIIIYNYLNNDIFYVYQVIDLLDSI